MTDSSSPQAGIADALTQLSEETRVLVRTEIEDAQAEMWRKAKDAAPALLLLGAGGALGLAASASAYRVVLRIFERATSPGFGALLATGAFGAAAFSAFTAGMEQLRHAEFPAPTSALRDAGDTVRAAADQVT